MRAPRRIVTGHNAQGQSVVAMDAVLEPTLHKPEIGVAFWELWRTKGSPVAVGNGADPTAGPVHLHPDAQGSVIRFVDFAPKPKDAPPPPPMSLEMARGAFSLINAADAATWKPGSPHPMMHRTESVDYGIVLEGEVTLVLDDGSETHLKAGDVVVQRGTDHAWDNRSDKPARMCFILLDGKFAPDILAALKK